jgi:hypothetical protein
VIIAASREYTVNMGNYESYKFGRSLQADTLLDLSESDPAKASDKIQSMLDDMLYDELREAAKLTDVRNSFILTVIADKYNG